MQIIIEQDAVQQGDVILDSIAPAEDGGTARLLVERNE